MRDLQEKRGTRLYAEEPAPREPSRGFSPSCRGAAPVLGLLFCLLVLPVQADSPRKPPPARLTYSSAQGRFRLEVFPNLRLPERPTVRRERTARGLRETTTQNDPLRDRRTVRVRLLDSRGRVLETSERTEGLPRGGAELRLVDTRGGKTLWSQAVPYTPGTALVSPSGRYVATFDRWYGSDDYPDTVVLYGPEGRRVRALSLSDFLSPEEKERLPHGVSNIFWGGGFSAPRHRFDEPRGVLVLRIATSHLPPTHAEQFMERRISLATGQVVPDAERRP